MCCSFLAALEKVLLDQGFRVPAGAGVAAAIQQLSAVRAACRSGRASKSRKYERIRGDNGLYPTIPNAGAMSEFIGAFDVPSKVTDYVYHCRFSHCWNGIATRHGDTMDCKFLVDGKGVMLGLGAPGVCGIPRRVPAATCRIAKPATSPRNICVSGSSRKTNTRFTTFRQRTWSASLRNAAFAESKLLPNLSRCSCYEPGGLDEAAVPFFANERT